ncbi:MAG: hypothetical protein R2750_10615 [Bacteroidales bacterium]
MPKLLHTGLAILILFFQATLYASDDGQAFLDPAEFMSTIDSENNGLLKFILIILIVIVFGYAAKLFYERRFRKE